MMQLVMRPSDHPLNLLQRLITWRQRPFNDITHLLQLITQWRSDSSQTITRILNYFLQVSLILQSPSRGNLIMT